jgi:taurine dioxygenase
MGTTKTLTVTPVGGALGARVEGIDLKEPLGDAEVEQILGLLAEHLVLFFPAQFLDDAQHLAFASAVGTPYVHPLSRAAGNHTAAVGHIVDSVETPPYQDKWHTDVSWDPDRPTMGTLRAIEMPSRGGDTIWSDVRLAYDALSPTMQTLIEPLEAWHDMGSLTAFVSKSGAELVNRTKEQFPGAAHPVVGTQARTGRKYLYVNGEFTRSIVGLHPDESAALLGFLVGHATNPNHQVRYRWTVGDVALWDELCTQHFAVADYMPERREMARVALTDKS